ncbi:MAG: hypothetical protein V4685_01245 [Bacteroidota bacterium]
MERNLNAKANSMAFFNQVFNCDKMRLLITDDRKENFSERFRNWLNAYTKSTKEKIWVDIESYHTG